MKIQIKLISTFFIIILFQPINSIADDDNNSNYKPSAVLRSSTLGSPRFLDGYGQTVKFKKSVHKNDNLDYLFVAAPFSRPNPATIVSGTIYVYKLEGSQWIQSQLIQTKGTSDHLGALDIEAQGDWLMFSAGGTPIGVIANDLVTSQDFKGSVQIYKFNKKTSQYDFWQALDSNTPGLQNLTGVAQAALNPSVPFFLNEQGAFFGLHFGLDAKRGRLLVGAEYQANSGLINSGAVYAFDLDEKSQKWVMTQSFTNPDGVKANDSFGYNVKINNKIALVSNGSMIQGPKIGPIAANSAVYVYNYDNTAKSWKYVQKLVSDQTSLPNATTRSNSSLKIGDSFGASMALDNKTAIIGAPLESKNGSIATLSGAVYFYTIENNSTLVNTQKIFSDDTMSYETGFINIDIDGNTAIISDPGRTGPNGDYQGGALVFKLKQGTWEQVATLMDAKGENYSFFGGAVSIGGNRIAVGGIPFISMGVVLLGLYVGPPFHNSLLLPPTLINPLVPIVATPVVVYDNSDDE